MKILIDVNLSYHWADMLIARGIEAVYWDTLGASDAPDTEIMAYAQANGYTVLTRDLDFSDILAASRSPKPSVVQIRTGDARPETMIKRMTNELTRLAAEIEHGTIVTLDEHKTRVHILPFSPKRASC
jgi:predicted nuclease of predicted toxin-antitoxin system